MDDSPELTEDQLWLAVADAQGPQRAELLRDLAVALYLRGSFQDAATTGEEAAAGFAEANLSSDEGFSRYGAGVAYQDLGRPAEALSLFTAAGACFRLSGDEEDCALATRRAGQCLNILGQPQEALGIWDSAQALFASIGHFALAADVALDRGNCWNPWDATARPCRCSRAPARFAEAWATRPMWPTSTTASPRP